MIQLNDKQIIEYLHRCYTAVDGLWFMKLEDKHGFDTALEIDTDVWRIMPKIQARALKAMANPEDGIEGLMDCFSFKMMVEDYTFTTEKIENPDGYRIIINKCPWLELLVKSGRENLAGTIGTAICNNDSSAWAAEFGDDIKFKLQDQMCKDSSQCILQFSH
ncbi:DUF6125 family protein [Chloroflexota bacterium]